MTTPASGKLQVTTPSDLEIVMSRQFEAPRPLVFDAFTRPEHVRRWLGRPQDTMTVCEIDLRIGGAWRYRWRWVRTRGCARREASTRRARATRSSTSPTTSST